MKLDMLQEIVLIQNLVRREFALIVETKIMLQNSVLKYLEKITINNNNKEEMDLEIMKDLQEDL
jgi:hypothetical protein